MIIKNGLVFTDKYNFEKKDIYINNHMIIEHYCELTDFTEIDAENRYVIPGLIDIHTHGSCGHDFCDNDRNGLIAIAKHLKNNGITSFCPTSMTLSKKDLLSIFKNAIDPMPSEGATIVGINMEGPFIANSKKGAQNGRYILSPDIEFFTELNQQANNLIKLVTIAPELENSLDFIKSLNKLVTISIGHSTADYVTATKAMDAGATHITHLYNAMPSYNHREPGIIGAAFDNKDSFIELICDGIHIHPSVIRSTFQLFGNDRVVLISDSMMAAGMPDGTYELGKQTVYVKNKKAVLQDGTLAGSASNLFDCMKNAVKFGIPLTAAVQSVTANPAKSIGIFDSVGSLTPGKKADILIIDEQLNLINIL